MRATDGAGATGVEWIERRVDGGAWTRADNTGNADPFETKFTVSGDGTHTVEYRARDKAGNVSDPVGSVTFAIDSPSGGGSCNCRCRIEFNGAALDPKWRPSTRRPARPAHRGWRPSDDAAAAAATSYAGRRAPHRHVLQAAPTGEWVATAKIAARQHQHRRRSRPVWR